MIGLLLYKNKHYNLEEPDEILSFEVSGDIDCKAKKDNEFYLDFQGNVHMCCYLGGSYLRKRFDECKDTILEWYEIEENNALQNDLSEILLNSQFFKYLQKSWDIQPSYLVKDFVQRKI